MSAMFFRIGNVKDGKPTFATNTMGSIKNLGNVVPLIFEIIKPRYTHIVLLVDVYTKKV